MTQTLPQSVVQRDTESAAGAAVSWQVQAGASTLDQAYQDLDFYDSTITINAGDSVTWRIASTEPHTVAFLAPGQTPPPPDSPQAAMPAGGHTVDGTSFVNSGIMGNQQRYTLTFPKPGAYKYYCLLHQPAMEGMINVQKAGTPYPHLQGFYLHEGAVDEWADLHAGQASVALFPFPPNGTMLAAGISPHTATPSQSTVLRFLSSSSRTLNKIVVVKVGTTVTWTDETNNEPHTVTFPVAGQPLPNIPPFSPPAGGPTYDGSTFTNSGVIPPFGHYSLTFTKKGSYLYYCLFHFPSGMYGRITVI